MCVCAWVGGWVGEKRISKFRRTRSTTYLVVRRVGVISFVSITFVASATPVHGTCRVHLLRRHLQRNCSCRRRNALGHEFRGRAAGSPRSSRGVEPLLYGRISRSRRRGSSRSSSSRRDSSRRSSSSSGLALSGGRSVRGLVHCRHHRRCRSLCCCRRGSRNHRCRRTTNRRNRRRLGRGLLLRLRTHLLPQCSGGTCKDQPQPCVKSHQNHSRCTQRESPQYPFTKTTRHRPAFLAICAARPSSPSPLSSLFRALHALCSPKPCRTGHRPNL